MAEESPITPVSPTPTYVDSFSRSNTATATRAWEGDVPFAESDQLCNYLEYSNVVEKPSHLQNLHQEQILPDAPRVALDSCEIVSYCLDDLDTPGMNTLGEKMWWAGPTPAVKSLSRQLAYDRRIIITEDISLHLLWTNNIIYIKPLPAYLTSYAFWGYILDSSNESINAEQRERLKSTSLGFLRTYAFLIQRRSDFNLGRRHDLLSSFGNTSFEDFVKFIKSFDSIPDKSVSHRWRFGEISLDALNFHSSMQLRRWHFNRFESNYGAYFQRFFPTVLFMFALFSVVLSAMQVILGGRQLWETDNRGLKKALGVFEWFASEAIGWSIAFGIGFLIWWICITSAEAWERKKAMKKVKKRQAAEHASNP